MLGPRPNHQCRLVASTQVSQSHAEVEEQEQAQAVQRLRALLTRSKGSRLSQGLDSEKVPGLCQPQKFPVEPDLIKTRVQRVMKNSSIAAAAWIGLIHSQCVEMGTAQCRMHSADSVDDEPVQWCL